MKQLLITVLLVLLSLLPVCAQDTSLSSTITKERIKIGEKIILTTAIDGLAEGKVFWEDMTMSDLKVEVIEKKDSLKKEQLIIEVTFTFFEPGEYKDFIFTIPIMTKEGDFLYLNTKEYTISVDQVLTDEQTEALKAVKDASRIELKPEKPQSKIRFKFSGIMIVLLFLLFLVLFAMIAYYFLYKYFIKKGKSGSEVQIPPFEKFAAQVEQILFEEGDGREVIERKLSCLGEALKQLITSDFNFNAPSETTRELLESLKEVEFSDKVRSKLTRQLTKMDMIKFAGSDFTSQELTLFKKGIFEIGTALHSCAMERMALEGDGEKAGQNTATVPSSNQRTGNSGGTVFPEELKKKDSR